MNEETLLDQDEEHAYLAGRHEHQIRDKPRAGEHTPNSKLESEKLKIVSNREVPWEAAFS